MREHADPRLSQRFARFAFGSSLFVIGVGTSALLGWAFHIEALYTWGAAPVTMKVNTAICFVMIGASLCLSRKEEGKSRDTLRKFAARATAGLTALAGLLSLIEDLSNKDLGIDQLFAKAPFNPQTSLQPGLMSPLTATAFLFLGIALLLVDWRTDQRWPAQTLSLGAAVCATFGILSFAFDPNIYASHLSLALPTAVSLLVVSLGIICSRTEWGLGALLCSQSLGGSLARRLLPAAFIPVVVGWIRWRIAAMGLYSEWSIVVLAALLTMSLLSVLIAWAAVAVDRGDMERQRVVAALNISQEKLDRLLDRVEEPPDEVYLRRKIAIGFFLGVLLTGLMGFFSWRNSQAAVEDADWVAHTHEVLAAIETTSQHLVDVETGGRGFALSGYQPFLQTYQQGKVALNQDIHKIRHLTADNFSQQERLNIFERRLNEKTLAADALVNARIESRRAPSWQQLDQGQKLMSAARAAAGEMQDEERRLLALRSEKARAARRLSITVTTLGSIVGVICLVIAGFVISRQLGVNSRARGQVNALNAELERRVEQRTAALAEKDSLLREAMNAAQLVVWDFDLSTGELREIGPVSQLFDQAEGFQHKGLEEWTANLHLEDRDRVLAQFNRAIAKGTPYEVEFRTAAGPHGDSHWLRAVGRAQHDSKGKAIHMRGVALDITARRQAEDALIANEEMLRLLLDGVKDYAVYMLDPDGRVASWNAGAARIKGYTADEILGKPVSIFYTPQQQAEDIPGMALSEALSKGRFEAQGQRVRKDGSVFWAHVVILPMYDNAGKLRGFSKVLHDISEQKRAEDALQDSEERFQTLANSIPQLAWSAEADGHIFWYNQRWYEYTGKTFEQMQGWGWQSVQDPEVLPRVLEGWKGALAAGHPWEMEFPLLGADGRFRTFLTRVMPLKDSEGHVVRWFGTNTDISEIRQTEEALREQARVVDLAQVLVRDVQDRIMLWSRGTEKLYGYSKEEAVGRVSHALLQTQLSEPLPQILKKLHEVGQWEGELVHHKRDGTRVVVQSLWVLHRDSQGRPVSILESNSDITERKEVAQRLAGQAEELSRQAEELERSREALEAQTVLLRNVLDSMAEGLVVADEHGKFIVWNPAAEKIVGLGAANLPSSEWTGHYGLFLPDTVTPFPPEQNPLLRGIRGEASATQMFIRNPELTEGVFIEASGGPLRDKKGAIRGGVVAFRDVTQNLVAERKIREMNDELEARVVERTTQLEAANRELESFTYSVAHDLRAPLRHISGFTRILVEDFGPSLSDEARGHLHRVDQGAQKMGQLVDELLNLARVGRQNLAVQVTGLGSIASEVISMLEPEVQNRQVQWKIAELPFVECDPVLTRQVFQNLISNALKYSRSRAPAVVEIGRTEKDGETVIFVRDNGVGFSMKYADKLFGVFQRLHRAEDFEGTGVGLATVQRIVQKHGGKVWAEAELDRGATFYFTLGGSAHAEVRHEIATAGGRS